MFRSVLLHTSVVFFAVVAEYTRADWSAVAPMLTPRMGHAAVSLADGRVLVCGGRNDSGVLSTCEIFDTSLNAWTESVSLSNQVAYLEMVKLDNGTVLAFGGRNDDGDVKAAELFDPTTEQWSPVPDLSVERHWPSVNRLNDGTILVAGGWGGNFHESAEIYNPITQEFLATGSHNFAVNKQSSVTLSDGRVLSMGGYGGGSTRYDGVDIYDPASGEWNSAASMTDRRYRFNAVIAGDGNVYAVGGGSNGSSVLSSVEYYDAEKNSWTLTDSMQFSRQEDSPASHYAVALPNGDILAFGGGHVQTERYSPNDATWSPSGSMLVDHGLEYASILLDDGRVLVIGGAEGATPLAYSEAFSPIPRVPGDTDNDGDIDLTDLNNARNHFGEGVILGPPVFGEAYPYDGVVDLGDLNLVRNAFGTTIAGSTAVPEPSTSCLAFAMLTYFLPTLAPRKEALSDGISSLSVRLRKLLPLN